MTLKRFLSLTRQAVDKYHMIDEGDHICVGISGGKDSISLLYALNELSKFYPKRFKISAITVDLGFPNFDLESTKKFCAIQGIDYHIVTTTIGDIVFNERKEKNPCSLCSKMRKGALNQKALEIGCNKIAYAHHKDDAIDTLFLSMYFEGKLSTFEPVTQLDKTGLILIRPLLYISESDIIGFKNKYELPVTVNPCPADGYTKREYVKNKIKELNKEIPGVKNQIFTAIEEGLYDK